jgi:hypothetical protein
MQKAARASADRFSDEAFLAQFKDKIACLFDANPKKNK